MTEEEFWSRIHPDLNSGCWLWAGGTHPGGYGTVKLGGRWWKAHRLAWSLLGGSLPAGLHACHKCDTPACVNPAHIFLGTDADNAADKTRKGRGGYGVTRGEKNPRTQATDEKVVTIRALSDSGMSAPRIAAQLSLPVYVVRTIARRQGWRHVPEADGGPAARRVCIRLGSAAGSSKLKEDDVRAIRRDLHATLRTLSRQYGVCESTISAIRNRHTWKHLEPEGAV